MAFQFVHMETYSRKGKKDGTGSTTSIFDEAERKPGACGHIENPGKPVVVYGVTVDAVRQMHDSACDEAKTEVSGGKSRAIRKDQKTLLTVVASYPIPEETLKTDAKARRRYEEWEGKTIAWLQKQHGDELVSVVRHEDEKFRHIHAYVLPKHLRALALHPGQIAKAPVVAAGVMPEDLKPEDPEHDPKKALNRRADRAYRQAMREWQDSYWNEVGIRAGLARLGPKKRRLSRAEWQAEQKAAAALQVAIERAENIEDKAKTFVANTKDFVAKKIADADAQKAEADRIKKDADALLAKARAESEKAKEAHDKAIREAETIVGKAQKRAKKIVDAAKREADKVISIGTAVRRFFDGFRKSEIREEARAEVKTEVERLKDDLDDMKRAKYREIDLKRKAEQDAKNAAASVHEMAEELRIARERLEKPSSRQHNSYKRS